HTRCLSDWSSDVCSSDLGAAVEDAFHARNSRVALKLGCVRGVAILPIMKARVPVYEYAPRLVKKAVTGSGAADKDQVRRMVRLQIGRASCREGGSGLTSR